MSQLLSELSEIIKATLDRSDLEITEKTSADDAEEWDSLTHLQMISAIEKKFKVRFALGELQDLQNVGDMLALLKSKLSN